MDSVRKAPKYRPEPDPEPLPVPPPSEPMPVWEPTPPRVAFEARRSRPFLWIFGLLGLLLLGAFGFVLYKSLATTHAMQFENPGRPSFLSQLKNFAGDLITQRKPLAGEKDGRINILLLGRAGEHYPGHNLTDTIMLMSIDTTTKKVGLLSLPRDLYVPIGNSGLSTKINALYQYGLNSSDAPTDLLKQTVQNITGEPIHYFVILDFDGFEKIVDSLHGIQVDVVRDFYDPRYPGKNYSYETFQIKKGWQMLDGATALKYVRERHNDPEGDFGRAKRQQQVIQAIKDKAFSLETFLNVFTLNNLLSALGESVKTDMTLDDMQSFIELSRTLDTKNVASTVVDAWKPDSLLRVTHIQVGPVAAFALVPRVGNWSEIQETAKDLFDRDAIADRKDHIESEHASVSIYYAKNDGGLAARFKTLLSSTLPLGSVTLVPTMDNRPAQSIIEDRANLGKPFTLDDLMKRFPLQKGSLPGVHTPQNADIAIFLGDDVADVLDSAEETPDQGLQELDQSDFQEPLPPQPTKKK